jgi:hypothetical protein
MLLLFLIVADDELDVERHDPVFLVVVRHIAGELQHLQRNGEELGSETDPPRKGQGNSNEE